jgi:putative endonuclease
MILNRRRLLADQADLGRWGQKRCERFLKNKGLRTLTRNFSCKTGELDLVMVDTDGMLVFIEVKTRAGEGFIPVEAAITSGKKRRVIRAARYFQAFHKIDDRPCRFDVVAVILGPAGPPEIRHYEAAFTP